MMVVSNQSMRHNMWTEITRPKYERAGRRYASDLTDAEWRLIEPFMPPVKRLGRPRETDLRAIVDAILYIARTGCQWRLLPKDFPPFTTVQGYFYDWRDQNLFQRINFELLLQGRRPRLPRRSKKHLSSHGCLPAMAQRRRRSASGSQPAGRCAALSAQCPRRSI